MRSKSKICSPNSKLKNHLLSMSWYKTMLSSLKNKKLHHLYLWAKTLSRDSTTSMLQEDHAALLIKSLAHWLECLNYQNSTTIPSAVYAWRILRMQTKWLHCLVTGATTSTLSVLRSGVCSRNSVHCAVVRLQWHNWLTTIKSTAYCAQMISTHRQKLSWMKV